MIIEAQAARRTFATVQNTGEAFGKKWHGLDSDWTLLRACAEWRTAHDSLPPDYFAKLAEGKRDQISLAHATLRDGLPTFTAELQSLLDNLKLDLKRAFGVDNVLDVSIAGLADRLAEWSKAREQVTRWIAFAERGREATRLGLGSLVTALKDGRLLPTQLAEAFDRAYFEALRSEIFNKIPEMRRFDGELHNRIVTQFRELDRQRIAFTRRNIAHKHAAGRPRGSAGVGPLGRLNEEIAKKRNLLPIRRLLEVAGPAIQQLKPVFMMSPLSVAQFLKPGALTFDLLVIDEASQIEPVDALGAIARCRQIVVVGDERQLPPTRFFSKLTSDDTEREEDETFQTKDAESVLELCLAKGLPYRLLNWHYRSRHQSLIAVSNREFYENRLFIIPSPYDFIAGMGLKFHHLPDAIYDRGNSRTNPIEAKAVADAIMKHAREHPEQSLGVATFSTAQRQTIIKELEIRRRAAPELENFFATNEEEPFFVKNLENVQGDERDVIFISVGYGKDSSGYMAMNFGPLNADGGERRLNVLISRAKLRCEVFSSITGDDIDLERARARGVAAFKLFLTFAKTGKFGLGEISGKDHDSVFEEQVAKRLSSLGYDVKTQIGVAGFFIDIAIADPGKPGRFILGVECDGAQYHSTRSARDRDRLRQQVLEDHNWIIHRIWSTDWYLRPAEEERKVEAAIRDAKAIWSERDTEDRHQKKAVPLNFTAEKRDDDSDVVTAHVGVGEPAESDTQLYMEASFSVKRDVEPHLAPLADMTAYITKVVEIEGPVHEDEIVARIRALWGLGRAGSRIRKAVHLALKTATKKGLISNGPFFACPGTQPRIRNRSNVNSPGLRKPEYLPPIEIEAALLSIVDQHFGASRDELVQATSRLLGFSATSAQLREVITQSVDRLLQAMVLEDQGGLLNRRKTVS
jgi:very-short-patch-repair endonuclease